MKIVLVQDLVRPHHALTEEHVECIKKVDSSLKVKLLDSTQSDEIQRELEDTDILAGALRFIPEIHDIKSLKWIHPFSAGVDYILTPEVKNSSVLVGNCSGMHITPIAEHVLGFLLIFTRRFYDTFENQQKKIWERNPQVTELKDKTVLVVGLGNIGREVARVVSCVGARILAVDRSDTEKPEFVESLYKEEQLKEGLQQADFVVLSVPLTPQTHHLFNMEKFRIMKDTAVIINISRGPVIREQELIKALQQKIIAGAALDVTEEEPLDQESPLWHMQNVVITPHHSGLSEKYMDRAVEIFCKNLQAYIQKKPLPNLVDKQKGY